MRPLAFVLSSAMLVACASSHESVPPPATPVASPSSTPSAAPSATPPTATSAVRPADGGNLAWAHDPQLAAEGKRLFEEKCAACHRADAGGLIGPNLTDAAWLHGGEPGAIFATVRHGWATKGMPSWESLLGDQGVRAVVAFVVSVRDTNVAGGKAPQRAP